MPRTSSSIAAPSFAEFASVFARIGVLSFGGPAGQIALMHRMLVEERRWVSEARYLHALNYCMLLPGPEAMQLATYVGWLLHGVRGGLVAGLLFVLPGAALLTLLSALYLLWGDVPVVSGLLFGVKAAVLAIVIEALIKVSRRALKGWLASVLAVAAFLALSLFNLPFPLVVLGAGAIGALAYLGGGGSATVAADAAEAEAPLPAHAKASAGGFAGTVLLWSVVWLGPLLVLWLAFGPGNVFVQQGIFFSIMAAVTFGGAYAVLAWVAQQAVEVYGWLRPEEMLTGLGLAETTPGPLILVLLFVGFLGGARLAGLEPLAGGVAGAIATLWFTFAPCFLWIFAGAPYVETVRGIRWLAAALSGVTAAVVGVIASLAAWFAIHVLFAEMREVALGPARLTLPDPASLDPAALLIAVAAGVALLRFHVGLLTVLGCSALAGAAWTLIA